MSKFIPALVAVLLAVGAKNALAQQLPVPFPTPVDPGDEIFTTTYVRLGPDTEGLLLTPVTSGPNTHIAMVFSHPTTDNFGERPGWYMVRRGYPVLLVNHRGSTAANDLYLPSISLGIAYMRARPGIAKVVLLAHSGGTHLGTLYQNVAENGPAACQGAEKIYPCDGTGLQNLAIADGLILLDPTLGAAHQATAIDPAVIGKDRERSLDMFAPENGFDANSRANYSEDFSQRFYSAQSTRNNSLIESALQRLRAIEDGAGEFTNDEPLLVKGIGMRAMGARLYQPDPDFQSHTKVPHLLLRADGSEANVVIQSVRSPLTRHPGNLDVLGSMNANTTVREFLASMAVRTGKDFAMTADDIVGVDWASSYTSTPANAAGVTVPTLVLTMTCHYLIVPGEIIYDRLASSDKTYAAVEGATHGFYPCGDEYGDTVARVFDFVDRWTAANGRFQGDLQ